MLDIRYIRDNAGLVREALKARGEEIALVDKFLALDEERRELIKQSDELKCAKNELSGKIGTELKKGGSANGLKEQVKELSGKIQTLDDALTGVDAEFGKLCDTFPNIPHESVPVGRNEKDNPVIKEHSPSKKAVSGGMDHLQIGEMCGLFDLARAARMTGSGFPMFVGQGARLERALINYMLDVHTREHGYTEVFPPFLVTRASMRGTGQLPKLESDMYRLEQDDLFLIPTAEVPVTNMHAGEILEEDSLPVSYVAYTACFRREAGSYGKDTKGLSRVHQFDKVELVKFSHPERSMEDLEALLQDAESILARLGLTYRVKELCTGDLSFAAHKCYDIELWAPSSGKWLEVSSCSLFSDFQARRADIKYRPSDSGLKARYLHTLNGSGVALPRLVIALLESFQNKDGSVELPEELRPYFGADRIVPLHRG